MLETVSDAPHVRRQLVSSNWTAVHRSVTAPKLPRHQPAAHWNAGVRPAVPRSSEPHSPHPLLSWELQRRRPAELTIQAEADGSQQAGLKVLTRKLFDWTFNEMELKAGHKRRVHKGEPETLEPLKPLNSL